MTSNPLTWKAEHWIFIAAIISKLAGLGVSAFAVSLGAPFWFNLLQKLVNIRSSGLTPSEKKKKEEAA